MKKFLLCFICLALLTPITAQANPINIFMNGQQIHTDAPPLIKDSRTYVPIRAISENFGCDVYFYGDSTTQVIKISKAYTVAEFRAGWGTYGFYGDYKGIYNDLGQNINNNNDPMPMYALYRNEKSFIKNGRTYVPLRLCSEIFNAKVQWDQDTQSVYITGTPGKILPPNDAFIVDYTRPGEAGPGVGAKYYRTVYGA